MFQMQTTLHLQSCGLPWNPSNHRFRGIPSLGDPVFGLAPCSSASLVVGKAFFFFPPREEADLRYLASWWRMGDAASRALSFTAIGLDC